MTNNNVSQISDFVKNHCSRMNCMACDCGKPNFSDCKFIDEKVQYQKALEKMRNAKYTIDFEAKIDVAGSVIVQAETEEEAVKIAKQIIKNNLNIEDCLIELGEESYSGDDITLREIGNPKKLNIVSAMLLE